MMMGHSTDMGKQKPDLKRNGIGHSGSSDHTWTDATKPTSVKSVQLRPTDIFWHSNGSIHNFFFFF
jgi:hypothetical protein